MTLNEAKKVLDDNGFLLEDGQGMNRSNLKKWLKNRTKIEFDNNSPFGRMYGIIVVEIPDDTYLPIRAIEIEENKQIQRDTSSLFLDEENEIKLLEQTFTATVKDITRLDKQKLLSYFKDLESKVVKFFRNSNGDKVYGLDRS